jgi:hypothetical protein
MKQMHKELARAVLAYDEAIQSCADDPETMSSFCTAQGDNLDDLYFRMMEYARFILSQPEPTNDLPPNVIPWKKGEENG